MVGVTVPDLAPRIVLATRPVNFARGHEGPAGVVENELGLGPYSGVAVVFRSEQHSDQVKVLWWDRANLMVAHKRLERGHAGAGRLHIGVEADSRADTGRCPTRVAFARSRRCAARRGGTPAAPLAASNRKTAGRQGSPRRRCVPV